MARNSRSGKTKKDVPQPRGKILIVDDEPSARLLLNRILVKQGYICEEADCAERALSVLSGGKVGLVLLDISMPGGSGMELLAEIKASYPDTSVVMATGLIEVATAVECIKKGADDYICKPFKIEDVVASVNKALNSNKSWSERNHAQMLESFSQEIKDNTLAFLNSVETPLELSESTANNYGRPILTVRIAQRILNARAELGGFTSLHQITVLRGIGPKRFNLIADTLGQRSRYMPRVDKHN